MLFDNIILKYSGANGKIKDLLKLKNRIQLKSNKYWVCENLDDSRVNDDTLLEYDEKNHSLTVKNVSILLNSLTLN